MAGGFFDLAGGLVVTGSLGRASTAGGRETVVFFLDEPLFTTVDHWASASISMADSTSVSLISTGSWGIPGVFVLRALLLFLVASSASKTESLSHQLGVRMVSVLASFTAGFCRAPGETVSDLFATRHFGFFRDGDGVGEVSFKFLFVSRTSRVLDISASKVARRCTPGTSLTASILVTETADFRVDFMNLRPASRSTGS
ncbi:hypothetical protein AGLY_006321 [Aphis glycines]|uniref:Uncharacterized protein n=1 Tax=Aphis glycines TaxID=307491 RepID=A0A6G0TRZ5_APHGL|nr:hypothetical protein AGLY_006321 [Aphis glycines]